MTRQTWYLIGGAALAVVAWFIFAPPGGERVTADLIDQFPNAIEKRPNPEVFSVVEATLGGVAKQAILVHDPSRLVYTVTVPDDAELRFSIGIQESEWTKEGDGVLFRVLVAAGSAPVEVLNVPINPFANSGDRGWHDLAVDLSEYSGETIDLYFNTNASPPARPPRDDRNGDAALWGALRVVAR
jgi:hypothetical protein